jgi:acyl-CoA synthetase (NDP forming)
MTGGAGAPETQAGPPSIGQLLRPRSIAVIGMSSKPGSVGRNVLANLDAAKFPGAVYLVGRSGGEAGGRPVLSDISQLPDDVDLAVLAVPAKAVIDTLQACAAKRVKSAVCFASGFAEMGDAGREQQRQMREIATEAGIALLGPNTIGFHNMVDGLHVCMIELADLMPPFPPGASGVAVLAQSGSLGLLVAESLLARDVPVCHVMPTGNEAQLGISDFVRYFADDPQAGVMAVYAEQIPSPAGFLSAARHARAQGKRIVLFHPGRSQKAQQATSSHTGSLAGNRTAMRIHAQRAGVAVVETLEELIDVAQLMLRYPDPPGGGLGIVTGSGAVGAIALDHSEQLGLDVPDLSPGARTALSEHLADFTPPRNPLDVGTLAAWKPELMRIGTQAMLSEPAIGAVLVTMPAAAPQMSVPWLAEFHKAARTSGKPAVYVIHGESGDPGPELSEFMREEGVIFMRSPERALRALARVSDFGQSQAALSMAAPGPAALELPRLGYGAQPEWLGKKVLAAAGVSVPYGKLARSETEAVAVAAETGYPVAMKAQAGALAHKSDAGGVLLNVTGEDAVREGWRTLHASVARSRPDVVLEGILIESMGRPGLELVVGARRDPDWGPVVMVGLGGIWVEALGDVRFVAADLPAEAIRRELGRLQGAKLLSGFRGAPPVDIDAVAETVATIGRLMTAHPEISEIDVNPLVAYPRGEGVAALDALIVTGPPGHE